MKIEGTKHTQENIIDEDDLNIEIRGVSMPENTFDFYDPIIEKIEAVLNSAKSLSLTMEITTYNIFW